MSSVFIGVHTAAWGRPVLAIMAASLARCELRVADLLSLRPVR
jgi:hypothetical protein